MTGHHEGQLDEQLIVGYLQSYQEESILTMDELWALRTALQTALIKLCSLLAVECLQVRACRKSAEENALRLYSMKPEEARDALRKLPLREPEYVERLCSRMREWGGAPWRLRSWPGWIRMSCEWPRRPTGSNFAAGFCWATPSPAFGSWARWIGRTYSEPSPRWMRYWRTIRCSD